MRTIRRLLSIFPRAPRGQGIRMTSATATAPAIGGQAETKTARSWQFWGTILVAPYVLVFVLFVIYPVFYAFWLAHDPLWNEADFVLRNEVCKTKELYYKVSTEPRIKSFLDRSPLDLVKLHHDLAEVTEKLVSGVRECSEAYYTSVRQTFAEFAQSLDPSGKMDAKISRCFEPYVNQAQEQRKALFEAFQKNLVDGLFWEPATADNRRLETKGQPSVGNSTTRENTNRPPVPEEHVKLDWNEYNAVHFTSFKSTVVEPAAAQIQEEEDQVHSVN